MGNSENHPLGIGSPFYINGLRMSAVRERGLREGCKSSTIFQDTTRLSGVILRRDVGQKLPIFKEFGRSSHHSRSISQPLISTCSAASHSLFGPHSPFLLDRVQKSSDSRTGMGTCASSV